MKKLNIIMVITCFIVLFNFFTNKNIVHAEAYKEIIPTVHDDVAIFENKSSYNSLKTGSIPNGISVSVKPSTTGVSIKIRNYGVDTVDSVTVKIKAPTFAPINGGKQKYITKTITKTKLKPLISKSATMNIPMRKTFMTYKGSVTIRDGKDIDYKTTYSDLYFTEEKLSKEWHKGNSKSLKSTVDYHFAKHYNDKAVKVKNISQYLIKASKQRKKVKNISKTTSRYVVTKRRATSKYLASIKVVDKQTKAYVIMHNSKDKKIFSYGGN